MTVKQLVKKIIPPLFIDLYRLLKKTFGIEGRPDPEYRTTDIAGFTLKIPYSSSIDRLIDSHPLYSRNLNRLVVFVQKYFPAATLIDVGANIGDTVALVRSLSNIPILCIEGEKHFFDCLRDNMKQFKDIETVYCFLGEEDGISSFRRIGSDTSLYLESSLGDNLEIQKLDTCLKNKRGFIDAKVFKIDTDGFEMKILRGASEYILRAKPTLFLEFSPPHYQLAGENPLALFDLLASFGYKCVLIYDFKGLLVTCVSLDDTQHIYSLCDYICQRESSIPYFDLAVFHETDQDLCKDFFREEKQFFRQFDILLSHEGKNNDTDN